MIVIPDIHGRQFWRHAAQQWDGKEQIIFLGDYLDPYPDENISYEEALAGFQDIIQLKEEHPDEVTLLLGNHDLHYMDQDISGTRYDVRHSREIERILMENFDLFQMAYEDVYGGKRYLFSHAGILSGWLQVHDFLFGSISPGELVSYLNMIWWTPDARRPFFNSLADVSYARCGTRPFGSMVWADLMEHSKQHEEIPGYYQVFGHTKVKEPVITPYFACLDCQLSFQVSDARPGFVTV